MCVGSDITNACLREWLQWLKNLVIQIKYLMRAWGNVWQKRMKRRIVLVHLQRRAKLEVERFF